MILQKEPNSAYKNIKKEFKKFYKTHTQIEDIIEKVKNLFEPQINSGNFNF